MWMKTLHLFLRESPVAATADAIGVFSLPSTGHLPRSTAARRSARDGQGKKVEPSAVIKIRPVGSIHRRVLAVSIAATARCRKGPK